MWWHLSATSLPLFVCACISGCFLPFLLLCPSCFSHSSLTETMFQRLSWRQEDWALVDRGRCGERLGLTCCWWWMWRRGGESRLHTSSNSQFFNLSQMLFHRVGEFSSILISKAVSHFHIFGWNIPLWNEPFKTLILKTDFILILKWVLARCRGISCCVCGNKNGYFKKAKPDLFPTLNRVVLCLNLTRPVGQGCGKVKTTMVPKF